MNKLEHNIGLLENLVTTQYSDYRGYIEMDGHNGIDIFKLCEDHGINRDKYFIIGFTCGEHTTTGIGKKGFTSCSALTLDKECYGNTFDEIKTNINSQSIKVQITRISFQMKYSDFGKYIKRFEFGIVTKLSKHITNFDIVEY